MSRQEYNQCMSPYMRGSESKEQRQSDMCQGAKICSGKAKTEEEARYLCSLPKEPKPAKKRAAKGSQSCEKEVLELASCIVERIDVDQASNINSIETAIINAMMVCKCPQK